MPAKPKCGNTECGAVAPDRRRPAEWKGIRIEQKFGNGGGAPSTVYHDIFCSWECLRVGVNALVGMQISA